MLCCPAVLFVTRLQKLGERPGAAGTTCASGPGAKGKILCRALLGKFESQGMNVLYRTGAALCWSCQKTALGTKNEYEVRKWTLGKILKDGKLARLGIGSIVPAIFLNTEAVGRKKNR